MTLLLLKIHVVRAKHSSVDITVGVDAEDGYSLVPDQGLSSQECVITSKGHHALHVVHIIETNILFRLHHAFVAHALCELLESVDTCMVLPVLLLPIARQYWSLLLPVATTYI